MKRMYRQGDVLLAKIYFKNQEQYKHRPVVVVGRDITVDIDIIISPITSSEPRNEFDVIINYWKEAGLRHLSVVRPSKIHAIPRSSFIRRLGTLHKYDLQSVLNKCRELF